MRKKASSQLSLMRWGLLILGLVAAALTTPMLLLVLEES